MWAAAQVSSSVWWLAGIIAAASCLALTVIWMKLSFKGRLEVACLFFQLDFIIVVRSCACLASAHIMRSKPFERS